MMKERLGLALIALALLVGLVALLLRGTHTQQQAVSGEEQRRAEAADPRTAVTSGDSRLEAAARREALAPVAVEPPAEEARSRGVVPMQALRGRVESSQGQPLPGLPVQLCLGDSAHESGMDFEGRLTFTVVERAVSDESGGFQFELPLGIPHVLRVPADEGAGWAAAELAPCFAGEQVVLRLQLAGGLRGLVREAGTGIPVEGALVRAWGDATYAYGPVESGPDGSFRLGGLPPGDHVCQVYPREHRAPPSVDFVVESGLIREVRIEVDRGLTLRGRITDAATGLPIEGAAVREGYVTPRESVLSDAAGEYVLPGVNSTRGAEIFVVAAGYGLCEGKVPAGEEDEARLDFVLTAGRRTVGRVLDGDGHPLAGVSVTAAASDHMGSLHKMDWRTTHTNGEGRFELTEVRRDQRHVLRLSHRGLGTRIYDFPSDERSKEQIDFGDLWLLPAGLIAGAVVTADGSPVPGAYMVLSGSNGDRYEFGRLPEAQSIDFHIARIDRSSNDRGGFQFGSLAGGKWTVRARSQSISGEAAATVLLADGETVDSLKLAFPAGGVIAGRVLDFEGREVVHAVVALHRPNTGYSYVQTGRDGEFRFDGLPDREYELRVQAPGADERLTDEQRRLSDVWVDGVRTGWVDFEVILPAAVSVRGRAIGPGGEPVAQARIRVLDAQGRPLKQALADEQGHFEIEAPEGLPIAITARRTIPSAQHAGGRADLPDSPEGRVDLPRAGDDPVVIRVP